MDTVDEWSGPQWGDCAVRDGSMNFLQLLASISVAQVSL